MHPFLPEYVGGKGFVLIRGMAEQGIEGMFDRIIPKYYDFKAMRTK